MHSSRMHTDCLLTVCFLDGVYPLEGGASTGGGASEGCIHWMGCILWRGASKRGASWGCIWGVNPLEWRCIGVHPEEGCICWRRVHPVDRQTPVKTLPSSIFLMRSAIRLSMYTANADEAKYYSNWLIGYNSVTKTKTSWWTNWDNHLQPQVPLSF